MKKLLLSVIAIIVSITSFAQEKDVTKFLEIPVDGTKAEMIAKLKEKGFTSTEYDKDVLEGEFNGAEVYLHIATNNNKVYRIMVSDKNTTNETNIKIRFNKLCQQFNNNPKYSYAGDQMIAEDEDISYEIIVNKKRYEAAYLQKPKEPDADVVNSISNMMLKIIEDSTLTDNERKVKQQEITDIILESASTGNHKIVWFMISEFSGKYYITMFYDNELNKANGEDL